MSARRSCACDAGRPSRRRGDRGIAGSAVDDVGEQGSGQIALAEVADDGDDRPPGELGARGDLEAAATDAPEEMPQTMPSSVPSRRAMSMACGVLTVRTSSTTLAS